MVSGRDMSSLSSSLISPLNILNKIKEANKVHNESLVKAKQRLPTTLCHPSYNQYIQTKQNPNERKVSSSSHIGFVTMIIINYNYHHHIIKKKPHSPLGILPR